MRGRIEQDNYYPAVIKDSLEPYEWSGGARLALSFILVISAVGGITALSKHEMAKVPTPPYKGMIGSEETGRAPQFLRTAKRKLREHISAGYDNLAIDVRNAEHELHDMPDEMNGVNMRDWKEDEFKRLRKLRRKLSHLESEARIDIDKGKVPELPDIRAELELTPYITTRSQPHKAFSAPKRMLAGGAV